MDNIQKYKNAVEELQASLDYGVGDYIDTQSLEIAVDVLKKQIPQKVKGDYHSCPHYRCPNCHSSVKMYEKDSIYPYCGFCGQALDWSDANG